MRNRNGQSSFCPRRIEQDQRFHLVWNLLQNTHVASPTGRNHGRERRFAQVRAWTSNNRLVRSLCGVVHTLKNRVGLVFIPRSLLSIGSSNRNSHAFLAVLSAAGSTGRTDEGYTEATIQNVLPERSRNAMRTRLFSRNLAPWKSNKTKPRTTSFNSARCWLKRISPRQPSFLRRASRKRARLNSMRDKDAGMSSSRWYS